MKYQYRVAYRTSLLSSRVVHRTVLAANPDEARRLVAALDSKYLGTVRSPQRMAEVRPLEGANR